MGQLFEASLLRGAAKAGSRFAIEVAVSFLATLCVTLALSGWFRPAASPAFVPMSTQIPVSTPMVFSPPPIATRLEEKTSFENPGGSQKTRKDRIPATHTLEGVTATPVARLEARPPHGSRTIARSGSSSCTTSCVGRSGPLVTNPELVAHPTTPDPRSVALSNASSDAGRSPPAFAFAVPTIAMPAVLTRSLKPVLHEASSVTELLVDLARKP
jgi:hypothetical protein